MELESEILERLQELRKWQVEQQERLLKQQQEQRDLLSFEQDRMYQALGLSVQSIMDDSLVEKSQDSPRIDENSCNDSILEISQHEHHEASTSAVLPFSHEPRENMEDSAVAELSVPALRLNDRNINYKTAFEVFSPRSEIPNNNAETNSQSTPERNYRGIRMEGVEPLSPEKPSNRRIAIDDLPVPSPKKDFTTLLEERLRDCEANEADIATEKNQTVIKRPFLRKGEGLARFRPNPDKNGSDRRARPRSSSLSANMHLSSRNNARITAARLKETPKSSKTTSRHLSVPSTAQTKLSLKNVPPAKKKPRSKSLSAVPNSRTSLGRVKVKPGVDMNMSSDIETKNYRESEEMRIFELLEQKAENSSFCSNSSTVMAIFKQSTPLKLKNTQSRLCETKQRIVPSPKPNESDTSLEEIVRSTKSNLPCSPVTKIRETVVKKDYVFSQWDKSKKNDENNGANSNCMENIAISTESYKTTHHTTIQYNNNNVNDNNNFCKKMILRDNEKIDESTSENNVDCDNEKFNIDDDGKNQSNNEIGNVSLHVRFSEYNEYKTIGLTDTSFMSNDSNRQGEYNDDKAWSDRSTSPDSSDIEILFANKNTKLSQISKNIGESSAGLMTKLSLNSEECTDLTTDDEENDYDSNFSTSCDEENITITEIEPETTKLDIHDNDVESKKCDIVTFGQEKNDVSSENMTVDNMKMNDTIFKSQLLKTRLSELEREIEIFRKENAALVVQRKKLQEEQTQLRKEFKEREETLAREKKSNDDAMQDEKKRLSREKAALENRLRDAREKSLHNKQERQETQILREQLDQLREETSQKENRWQAAQARQKSQIRVLQTENTRLKQELENLRATRTNASRLRRPASNTRAINQIGKQLENRRKNVAKKDSSSDDDENGRKSPIIREEMEEATRMDNTEAGVNQQAIKSDDELRRKRNLYANLLSEATQGLRGNEEIVIGKISNTLDKSPDKYRDDAMKDDNLSEDVEDSLDKRNSRGITSADEGSAVMSTKKIEHIDRLLESSHIPTERTSNVPHRQTRRWSDVSMFPAEKFDGNPIVKNVREVQCPDGHSEIWYSNGNVKKIYPDRNSTKMIYYNGDVCESVADGSIKYFYASTRTWHTTFPDGLEILEFPDGQVERRLKDGTTEVSFPDGSVRTLESDGTEKWILPDGTIAETFPDGNKILSFPNGQREVHTVEHKRREYPDGTVKLVYPDGTQETRYSSGRVRVKDKDGNLLVDVHHR